MACIVALFFGLVVVWGLTLTPLFDLAQPSCWQAVGLIILGKLLFGGIGHHPHGSSHPSRQTKWHDRFAGRPPGAPPCFDHGKENDDLRAFWESEGKQAFEAFLAQRQSQAGGAEG